MTTDELDSLSEFIEDYISDYLIRTGYDFVPHNVLADMAMDLANRFGPQVARMGQRSLLQQLMADADESWSWDYKVPTEIWCEEQLARLDTEEAQWLTKSWTL